MGGVEDDIRALRRRRATLRRRDAALRAAIRNRLAGTLRAPASFAGAALLGALLGLFRAHPGPRRERDREDMPSFARWMVIAAELSGPLLSLVALARQRRSERDAAAG